MLKLKNMRSRKFVVPLIAFPFNYSQQIGRKTEQREISEVLTAGTVRDLDLIVNHPDAQYLLSIKENEVKVSHH